MNQHSVGEVVNCIPHRSQYYKLARKEKHIKTIGKQMSPTLELEIWKGLGHPLDTNVVNCQALLILVQTQLLLWFSKFRSKIASNLKVCYSQDIQILFLQIWESEKPYSKFPKVGVASNSVASDIKCIICKKNLGNLAPWTRVFFIDNKQKQISILSCLPPYKWTRFSNLPLNLNAIFSRYVKYDY